MNTTNKLQRLSRLPPIHHIECLDEQPAKRRRLNISLDNEFERDHLNNQRCDIGDGLGEESDTTKIAPEAINHALSNTEGNSRGNKICFGMICGAWVSLFPEVQNLIPDGPSYSTQEETGALSLVLSPPDVYFVTSTLKIGNKFRIGTLDIGTARGLTTLSNIESVDFDVTILPSETPSPPVWEDNSMRCRVTINVYGLHGVADRVGKNLSKARLYLQPPDGLHHSVAYHNPHYFTSELNVDSPAAIQSIPTRNIKDDVASILDSLSGDPGGVLADYRTDRRIQTQLLRHQKEAIIFMNRLEGSHHATWSKIWQQESLYGESIYRNTITDCKTQNLPDIARGGILADTMGLGKTLTTLALIMGSIDTARNSVCHIETAEKSASPWVAKTTLIIVPLSLLTNWCEEVGKHVEKGAISVHSYHGRNRIKDPVRLQEFDVILTTYSTVASESTNSPLKRLEFFRIVLDEAHIIRGQKTKLFAAVHQLSSSRRWCLTGTPMQNKLEDMESLLRFIRLEPFDDGKTFHNYITGPLKTGSPRGIQNLRTLLSTVCLRRTTNVLHDLPEIVEEIRVLELSPEERTQYSSISEAAREDIDSLVSSGGALNVYQCILKAILRLRLLCNHGTSGVGTLDCRESSLDTLEVESQLRPTQQESNTKCSHCFSAAGTFNRPETREINMSQRSVGCSHTWCEDCISQYKGRLGATGDQRTAISCPLCENIKTVETSNAVTPGLDLVPDSGYSSSTEADYSLQTAFSTKISAVLKDIEEGQDKSIVFSYWTKTLDIVGKALSSRQIDYVRLDGSLNVEARKRVIDEFRRNPKTKTLLMTTGAGACGLNLTVASQVHIIEPQWNPMVEAQAIGRVYRHGQTKPVKIFRYIMRETIEETVQSCRLKKLRLAELTLSTGVRGKEAPLANRIESLRELL
ncbi:SNF2 family N-terminal domain-containing protein [Pyronema omphalodes]|nr:SNF2 family N-terminal domain-containing protein [Pyronema omphalodes]